MKILVVCDVLGKENNGTTIAAMNLIRYLRSRDHEVRILCADQDKKGEENTYVSPSLNLGKLLNAYVAKVGVTIARADESIVREAVEGVDHIHIMLPFSLGTRAVKIARELGIPTTAGFHMQAENLTSHLKLNRFGFVNRAVYRYVYKHFYRYVDAIHYPTEFIRGVFERGARHTTNGYVISNGVHSYVRPRAVEKPADLSDKIIILSTGRFSREKSQDTLIKAVNLSKHRDRIQLILGGHGPKERYYKRLAKKLPIPPRFEFYSREEIIDVLNFSDIYVHPAQYELEGISCLEAIVCGKLTVVSDSPKAATGAFAADEKCIFKSRSPRSLASVIDYWIEHPDERRDYEGKYLDLAAAYDQDECMRKMEAMMEEVGSAKREKDCVL